MQHQSLSYVQGLLIKMAWIRMVFLAWLLLLAACSTPAAPYRTTFPAPPPNCTSGDVPEACQTSRHLHTNDYDLLFVEFDDQGLLYPTTDEGSPALWPQQINEVMERLHQLAVKHKGNISFYLFVHGWKHNASTEDDDVKGFRKLLQSAALAEEERRPIGIYVAWRGLSATVEPFLELSFWERKATALYVAQGSVRVLLSRLKGFQQSLNCWTSSACVAGIPRRNTFPYVRFVMIGHSFGGLILYNAISEMLIDGLTYREDSADPGAPAVRFGDMVILLNPAFEASRYTPLHRIVTDNDPNRSFNHYQAPILVSITSSADWATRWAFPLGRFLNTIFEQKASPEESTAIKNTMGHVDLYITHKLSKMAPDPNKCQGWKDISTVEPTKRSEQMLINMAAENENDRHFFDQYGQNGRTNLPDGWTRKFCGGAVLSHVRYKSNSPIWNIRTDESLMTGHGDIWDTALTNFLRQLYKDSSVYPIQ